MNKFSSIFGQILQIFSRSEFYRTVMETGAEKGAKGFRSSFGWSLSNLVAMLRYNLFTYRDLWAWINNPYEMPQIVPDAEQLSLKGI